MGTLWLHLKSRSPLCLKIFIHISHEHDCPSICLNTCYQSCGIYTQKWNRWVLCQFYMKLADTFLSGSYKNMWGLEYLVSLSTLVIFHIYFYYSHPNEQKVLPHDFDFLLRSDSNYLTCLFVLCMFSLEKSLFKSFFYS